MALAPQYAQELWGCALCGAYPDTSQVFFAQTPDEIAEREAARQADEERRSTPGWGGPQETTLPGGIWLCAEHLPLADRFTHLRAPEALAAMQAEVRAGR